MNDDLISRQQAIKELKDCRTAICKKPINYGGLSILDKARVCRIDEDIDVISKVPFVKQSILNERTAFKYDILAVPSAERFGHWIKHNDKACWVCSECGTDDYYAYEYNSITGKYELQDKFCPNCGADMRGADNARTSIRI